MLGVEVLLPLALPGKQSPKLMTGSKAQGAVLPAPGPAWALASPHPSMSPGGSGLQMALPQAPAAQRTPSESFSVHYQYGTVVPHFQMGSSCLKAVPSARRTVPGALFHAE